MRQSPWLAAARGSMLIAMLPAALCVLASLYVSGWSVTFSFTNIELTGARSVNWSWVGIDNYRNLFTHKFFYNALWNTIVIGVLSAVPQLMMALGIAHLLNMKLRGRTFFRVAILMPYATSLAAATVIFIELFSPDYGLINWVLHHVLHLPAVDWQSSKWPSRIAVAVIVMWRWTGYNALIYLASMQAIDPALYEAAAIDGASKWQQFRYVTIPGLRPTIAFTVIVSIIGSFQLFGEPLLYDPTGQPSGGSSHDYQTLGLLMYQQGWTNDRLGLAAATAWTMFVIILLAVGVHALLARRRTRRDAPRGAGFVPVTPSAALEDAR